MAGQMSSVGASLIVWVRIEWSAGVNHVPELTADDVPGHNPRLPAT